MVDMNEEKVEKKSLSLKIDADIYSQLKTEAKAKRHTVNSFVQLLLDERYKKDEE